MTMSKKMKILHMMLLSSVLCYNAANADNNIPTYGYVGGDHQQGDSSPKPVQSSAANFKSADGLQVKLKAGFDFIAAYHDRSLKSDKPVAQMSPNNDSFVFMSDANMAVNIENKTECGLTYGAQIVLETTAKNIKRMASGLYLTSDDFGRLELGSDKSPHSKMKINGFSVVVGGVDVWDSWVNIDPDTDKTHAWVLGQSSYIDSKTRTSDKSEFARKISYYTPKFHGFQIGIGYVPDTANGGYGPNNGTDFHTPVKLPEKEKVDVKNGIAGGITYEGDIGETTKVKFAVIGEYGKAVARKENADKTFTIITDKKFNDLCTWAVGGQVTFDKISFAAGYYHHGKSLLPEDSKRTASGVASVGIGYTFESGYKTNISYLNSGNKNHSVHAVSWGHEYKLAPGLLPYGMMTYYNGTRTGGDDGTETNTDGTIKTHKNNGILIAAGIRIEI